MNFKGKVVLITGAAGEIGSTTARQFAEEGAKLALVDLDMKKLDKVASELGLGESDCIIIQADVTIEEQVKNYVAQTVEKFGRIDVFFNNAGIEGKFSPIVELSMDNLDRVLAVNVKGVICGLKYVLPVMMEQKSGSVINTSSLAGWVGSAGLVPYIASKHAVIGITKTAALECVDFGVRVNAICPGSVNSRMMRSIEVGASPENPNEVKEAFEQLIPMHRYAEVTEVADYVMFLASDKSSYVTGTACRLDGGMATL
ncbi:MAG: SDR family NAD(P)-dependent oxidoreductase [Bacillota bacterium]